MAKNATQSQGTLVSPTIDETDSGWMMATLYLHSDSGHNFNEWSAAKGETMCGTMSSIPRPQEVGGYFAFFVLSRCPLCVGLPPDTVGKSDGLNGCTRVHSNIFHWIDPEWDDKNGTRQIKWSPSKENTMGSNWTGDEVEDHEPGEEEEGREAFNE